MGLNKNKNWDYVECFSPKKNKNNKGERAKSTPPACRFRPTMIHESPTKRSICNSYEDKFRKSKGNDITPRERKGGLTPRSPRLPCASTQEPVVTPRRFRCSPPKDRNEMYTACSDITSGGSTPRGCTTPRRSASKSLAKDRNEMYTACSDITSLSPRSGRSTPQRCAEKMRRPRKYGCGSDAGSDVPRSGNSTPTGQGTPRGRSPQCARSTETSPNCRTDALACGRNGRTTPLDLKNCRISPRPDECGRLSSLSARSPTCGRPALNSPTCGRPALSSPSCGRPALNSPCSRSGRSSPCSRSGHSTSWDNETNRVRFMTTTCMTPTSLSVSPRSACDNPPLKPSCVISRKREVKDPGIQKGKNFEKKEDKRLIRLAQERIERLESSLHKQREMVCTLRLQLTHDGPKDYTKIRQTLENLERTIKKLIVSKNLHLPESKEYRQTAEQIERLKAHCYLLETDKERLKIQVRTLLETSKRRKDADTGAGDTAELCKQRIANKCLVDVLTSCQCILDELKDIAGASGENVDMNIECSESKSELAIRLAKKIKNDIRNVKDALNCSNLKKDESGACCKMDCGQSSGVRMQKLRDEIKLINHELQVEGNDEVECLKSKLEDGNKRMRELENEVECLKGKLEKKTNIICERDCKIKAMEEEMRAERERWNSNKDSCNYSAKTCGSELDDSCSSTYNIDDWEQLIALCEEGIASKNCKKQNTKSRFVGPIETRKCASKLDYEYEERENCRSSPLLKKYMGRLRSRSKMSSCRSSTDVSCFFKEDEDCYLRELSQTSRNRRLEKEDVLRLLTSTNGDCNTIFSLVQGALLSHYR